MTSLASTPRPWIRRLDHLICEVSDIEEAMELFVNRLGFPVAWPIGPFWPNALTSGVALGGFNLEFVQSLSEPVTEARIKTLVFEPMDLALAHSRYEQMGFGMELREKWEPDPELLKLRGFSKTDDPQLICRNLIPTDNCAIDFFLCDYSLELKKRLSPMSFDIPPIAKIGLAGPNYPQEVVFMNTRFPLSIKRGLPEIGHTEEKSDFAEVVKIWSDRGPLDFGDWPARFKFV